MKKRNIPMLGSTNSIIHSRDGEANIIELDPMEENDIVIIEDEGINRLIHEIFVAIDENKPMDKIYEYIHDVPLY